MIDSVSSFLNEYGMVIFTGVAGFLGGILSHIGKLLISLYLSKRDKLAEKRAVITEEFYNKVYHIEYLITEYFKDYSDLEVSLSGLNLDETQQSVLDTYHELRASKYQYETYLNEGDKTNYERLMTSIRDEYDGSFQEHNAWMPDDEIRPLLHKERELRAIQEHIKECLTQKFD